MLQASPRGEGISCTGRPSTLADSTGDGYVDGVDLLRLSVAFASDVTNARWDPTVDLDGDGFISGVDLALMAAVFAQSCP